MSRLKNVTIGENVETIDNEAFDDCNNIKSITIPNSVTEIGHSAFGHCI